MPNITYVMIPTFEDYAAANPINPSSVQVPHSSSQSISALGSLMAIAKDSPECVGSPNQSPISDLHFLDREKHQCNTVHHGNEGKRERRNGYNESVLRVNSKDPKKVHNMNLN
ncbi:hypothetical protein CR513_00651, partial [Mucuna pruriens]